MMSTNATTKSYFPLIDYKEASPKVKEIYDDAKITLQLPFVLNWFKCQGSNDILLEGNWIKLKNTLIKGNVPNVLKQMIILNVSKSRNCSYCAYAHGVFADSMRTLISDNENFRPSENLDSPLIPMSYRIAIKVITKAALHPGDITQQDFGELSSAGFSKAEIRELMAQADLVNMLNTLAEVSGIEIDKELLQL